MSAKAANKPGRPLKDIKDREVLNLAKVGCTDAEIAELLDCSESTITHRFCGPLKRGRDMARASLRRAQFKAALGGNPTMLIWLGKQLLGQRNEPRADTENLTAPPSMIEMAAAMDASIPSTPGGDGTNGNGAAKCRERVRDTA